MRDRSTAGRGGRLLRSSIGPVIGAACLAWVIHDVELGSTLDAVRRMRWDLVALAIAFDVVSFVAQGGRWTLLLSPVGTLSWLDATQAVYAGLFANEVLPMRAGELLRGYLVGRRLQVGLAAVLPSMLVERLFDGVWLAVGIGLAAATMPLPAHLQRAGHVLGLVIVLATGLFLRVVLRAPRSRPTVRPSEGTPTLRRWLAEIHAGLRQIGLGRTTAWAFVLSLVLLVCQAISFWLVVIAYGFDLGFWMGAVVLIIVRLGTAVPNTPANVGTYQFFCVVGMTLVGVDQARAAGFSVVVFVLLTAPLWLLGAIAVSRTGTSLADMRRAMRMPRRTS